MKRWPNRAEVSLEAGKTASRDKTKRGNHCGTGRKRPKNSRPEQHQAEIRSFSAACSAVPTTGNVRSGGRGLCAKNNGPKRGVFSESLAKFENKGGFWKRNLVKECRDYSDYSSVEKNFHHDPLEEHPDQNHQDRLWDRRARRNTKERKKLDGKFAGGEDPKGFFCEPCSLAGMIPLRARI